MAKKTVKQELGALGYPVLVLAFVLWFVPAVDRGIIAILSVAAAFLCLFFAPTWCGADTTNGGACRNNSYGVLTGCHIRQHKHQKSALTRTGSYWQALALGSFGGIRGQAAVFSSAAGGVSAVVALIAVLAT